VIPEKQIQDIITQILRREGGNVDDPLDHYLWRISRTASASGCPDFLLAHSAW